MHSFVKKRRGVLATMAKNAFQTAFHSAQAIQLSKLHYFPNSEATRLIILNQNTSSQFAEKDCTALSVKLRAKRRQVRAK